MRSATSPISSSLTSRTGRPIAWLRYSICHLAGGSGPAGGGAARLDRVALDRLAGADLGHWPWRRPSGPGRRGYWVRCPPGADPSDATWSGILRRARRSTPAAGDRAECSRAGVGAATRRTGRPSGARTHRVRTGSGTFEPHPGVPPWRRSGTAVMGLLSAYERAVRSPGVPCRHVRVRPCPSVGRSRRARRRSAASAARRSLVVARPALDRARPRSWASGPPTELPFSSIPLAIFALLAYSIMTEAAGGLMSVGLASIPLFVAAALLPGAGRARDGRADGRRDHAAVARVPVLGLRRPDPARRAVDPHRGGGHPARRDHPVRRHPGRGGRGRRPAPGADARRARRSPSG